MSKKIILSEKKEQKLFENIINEEVTYLGDKEELVKKWLSQHFKPMEIQTVDELSLPKKDKAVCVLDAYGQLSNTLKTLDDVFYILQTKFKKILSNTKDRDNFLWSTLNNWYN